MLKRMNSAILAAFVPAVALAEPTVIGPGDFSSNVQTINFENLPTDAPMFIALAPYWMVIESQGPIGSSASSDPADSLQPGESVSHLTEVINTPFPNSTPSPPQKLIATKFGADGQVIQCNRCGLELLFGAPFPIEVGLYVTDVDAGQKVEFFGPRGLLYTQITRDSNPPGRYEFAGIRDPAGIVRVVLTSRAGVGIGVDNIMITRDPAAVNAAKSCGLLGFEGLLPLGLAAITLRRWPRSVAPHRQAR